MASNTELYDTSFLTGANAAFIEGLYDQYVADPNSVDESWRQLFEGVARAANGAGPGVQRPAWGLKNGNGMTGLLAEEFLPPPVKAPKKANGAAVAVAVKTAEAPVAQPSADAVKQAAVDSVRASQMVRAYRARGHLAANLDPLKVKPP